MSDSHFCKSSLSEDVAMNCLRSPFILAISSALGRGMATSGGTGAGGPGGLIWPRPKKPRPPPPRPAPPGAAAFVVEGPVWACTLDATAVLKTAHTRRVCNACFFIWIFIWTSLGNRWLRVNIRNQQLCQEPESRQINDDAGTTAAFQSADALAETRPWSFRREPNDDCMAWDFADELRTGADRRALRSCFHRFGDGVHQRQPAVEAAILGVIDFPGHQAAEHGADFGAAFISLNNDLAGVGGRNPAGEDQAYAQGGYSKEGTPRNKTEGKIDGGFHTESMRLLVRKASQIATVKSC